MIGGIIRHNCESRHPKDDLALFRFELAKQFQRRFLKNISKIDPK
jgi:hypothetical protein